MLLGRHEKPLLGSGLADYDKVKSVGKWVSKKPVQGGVLLSWSSFFYAKVWPRYRPEAKPVLLQTYVPVSMCDKKERVQAKVHSSFYRG